MKTLRDFLQLLKEKIKDSPGEALTLVEMFEREACHPEDFERYIRQAVTMETLVELRRGISHMFAWRIQVIQTEARYEKAHIAHVETIRIFDDLAGEHGFIITEKRSFVSFTEMARDMGIIQVTSNGVSLTPKGEQMAEEVRREIEGDES